MWRTLIAGSTSLLLVAGCTGSGGNSDPAGSDTADTEPADHGTGTSGGQTTGGETSGGETTGGETDAAASGGTNDSGSTGTDAIDSGSSDSGDGGPSGDVDCDNPQSDWLFCEDFEHGSGDWQTWFDDSDFLTANGGDNRDRIDLSDQYATSGDWAVHMPADEKAGYRGADLTWYECKNNQEVNCELGGHEKLYFRTMVRLGANHNYVHHFLNIRGMDRFWSYGKAGCLPNGESTMGTTVDLRENSHDTFFYTYHLDMNCDANCGDYLDVDEWCQQCKEKGFPTCEDQKQCCWGDNYEPDQPKPMPTGEWVCFEMMMDPNTPGQSDGKMAYWIDGELGHRVTGLRWRTTDSLQLNQVRLQHFISSNDNRTSANPVWFDDVVVSTKRIGCP